MTLFRITDFSRAIALTAALVAAAPSALHSNSLGWHADALASQLASQGTLPVAPEGVAELRFGDIYQTPAGPRGLEFTGRIQSLDGRRVRVMGFMVRQEHPVPHRIILAPYAFTTNEAEYGLCDDLPPGIVFVDVPASRTSASHVSAAPFVSPLFAQAAQFCCSTLQGEAARAAAVPYMPGPLLLTGRLELGRREEPDGRVSYVRLVLDPVPTPGDTLRVASAAPPTLSASAVAQTAGVSGK
ncbi:hypothetical protein [Geminisphaera colitermitum]|uniref:hypothetical protein n=1 Tax=Geminisphaera colitermitum TaxID=1148786 RepID=UPI000158C57B|nr:hypothetical protein [Geminisphaera colitermitum]